MLETIKKFLGFNKNELTLSEELKWRGLVNQTTYSDLKVLDNNKITFYHGFDASAPSQTIGNLAAMMLDLCFLRHGHKAIILAGGSTSLVGDPGGKDSERPLQTVETISYNVEQAKKQISKIFRDQSFTLVNNLDWTKDVKVLDFLRDTGKFFNVGEMIKKDFVANRIGEDGAGISYTEFTYTILQAFDYLHLFDKYGCTLQLGGSDQWGNCISGVDLVRKSRGKEVNVITIPLIINKATGKKFGKSEGGAVWLDAEKTSPYEMYQFWINTDDEASKDYIKIFTDIQKSEFEKLEKEFDANRQARLMQKELAFRVVELVHSKEDAESCKLQSEKIFEEGGAENAPVVKIHKDNFSGEKINVLELLTISEIVESKGKVRELINGGGLTLDDIKVSETEIQNPFKDKNFTVVKIGKKKFYKLEII